MSRLSIERYKDIDSSPSGTGRKFLDTNNSPGKPSVGTFRGGLVTQDAEFSKYGRAGQGLPSHIFRINIPISNETMN